MTWTTVSRPPVNIPMPVYNPIVWKVLDTSFTQVYYKYVAVLKVRTSAAVAYTVAGTYSFFPLTDGTCEFDVAPILRDYVSNEYSSYDLTGVTRVRGAFLQYYITWYRVFGTTTTEAQYVKEENIQYAFDGALPDREFYDWAALYAKEIRPSIATDLINIGSVMSNVPERLSLKLSDYYTVDFLGAHVGEMFSIPKSKYVKTIRIITYSQHYLYGYHSYEISASNTNLNFSNPERLLTRLGIGPANLNAIPHSVWASAGPDQTLVDGAYPLFPVIDNYCEVYEVMLIGNNGELLSHKPVVVYPDLCTEDTMFPNITGLAHHVTYRNLDRRWLVYKNKYGAYSWLEFFAKARKSVDVKKNTYEKMLRYDSNKYSRATTVIGSTVTEEWQLNSLPVQKSEEPFYEELLCSPSVYMMCPSNPDGTANAYEDVIPVTVSDGKFKILDSRNEKMVQYDVNVSVHAPKNIQRS